MNITISKIFFLRTAKLRKTFSCCCFIFQVNGQSTIFFQELSHSGMVSIVVVQVEGDSTSFFSQEIPHCKTVSHVVASVNVQFNVYTQFFFLENFHIVEESLLRFLHFSSQSSIFTSIFIKYYHIAEQFPCCCFIVHVKNKSLSFFKRTAILRNNLF